MSCHQKSSAPSSPGTCFSAIPVWTLWVTSKDTNQQLQYFTVLQHASLTLQWSRFDKLAFLLIITTLIEKQAQDWITVQRATEQSLLPWTQRVLFRNAELSLHTLSTARRLRGQWSFPMYSADHEHPHAQKNTTKLFFQKLSYTSQQYTI